jgi:hypothetical protein
VSYSDNDVTIPANQNRTVTLTNTYEQGKGSLIVNKLLAGSFTDWGVTEITEFQARVKVVGGVDAPVGEYLTLSGTAPNYTYTGTSLSGSVFNFTQGRSAAISGIPGLSARLKKSRPPGLNP